MLHPGEQQIIGLKKAEGWGPVGTKGGVVMVKKSIWVTGQLPPLSITINGPAHTCPSINALGGS